MPEILQSEEDVRTKLVIPWLSDHGFSALDLSLEFSFRVKLGRAVLEVSNGSAQPLANTSSAGKMHSIRRPRADILVRNSDGQNLLIVEVKAPGEPLSDDDRDQGISYARCLLDGNIAPYVVLTNGGQTRIFDSFSRLEIVEGIEFLGSRASSYQSFFITGDELALRAEALETLVSFSTTNLHAFCAAQTKFRMELLASEQVQSERKFIPSLYVKRADASQHLSQLLDIEKRRVVLITGHPQVGKTNFVCDTVLERLALGHPCLFFPAISLRNSLLDEISDDFEWSFGLGSEKYSLLIRKLLQVLRRAESKLTIFIDGWNEANLQLAKAIDAECRRISNDQIQIVLSLTHSAATRLLKGSADCPSFLATQAGIGREGPDLIELDPEAAEKQGWSYVHVRRFSEPEQELAYARYKEVFKVDEPPNHVRTFDPYVLGIAMRQYSGKTLPDLLDEPTLLIDVLKRKADRAVGLEDLNVAFCLKELAEAMVQRGAPIHTQYIAGIWGLPASKRIPAGFFDAALLTREVDELGLESVDFYYGRERDYAIAYLARAWHKKLNGKKSLEDEFVAAIRTNPGKDAVRWFLKHERHLGLLKVGSSYPHFNNVVVRRIFLSALCEYASNLSTNADDLLQFAFTTVKNDKDRTVRLEAAKLVALMVDDANEIASFLEDGDSIEDFVEAVLNIGEDYPLHAESAGQVALDALQQLHWSFIDPDDSGRSVITDSLSQLCDHDLARVRREANTSFAHVSPFAYVEHLAEQLANGWRPTELDAVEEYLEALKVAQNGLADSYYGGMCRGALEAICEEPESKAAEYRKMLEILTPIIGAFGTFAPTETFTNILDDLYIDLADFDENGDLIERDEAAGETTVYLDTYTLPLPFESQND